MFTQTETRMVRMTVAQAAVTRDRMLIAAREALKIAKRYETADPTLAQLFADRTATCLGVALSIDTAFSGFFHDTDDTDDTDSEREGE